MARSSRTGSSPDAAGTHPPRLDALRLVDLGPGDADLLSAHETTEGERFESIDLSGRDLAGLTLLECELRDVVAHETLLRGARFAEVRIERMNAPVLPAPRSSFLDVVLEGSRLGSAEFFDADWQSVHLIDCKLGFVNLRGAQLRDVRFTNCTIDELDLGGARAERVAFDDSRVESLDLTRATLDHVDLRSLEMRRITGLDGMRGATVSSAQASDLAAMLAAHLGLRVED
jgi:uncharacterized protein YjbI with pentapeptide repeats